MRTLFPLIIFFLLLNHISFAQNKVAIVGGGVAGVASAYYIHQYDSTAQIILFEKEEIVGGNAKTVEVPNKSGNQSWVDIGPQYFTEGPWDDYIHFLKETIGWKEVLTESMAGTLLIQRNNQEKPIVVTPLNGKFRGEKLGNLLKLKKFNTEAFNVYKNPQIWKEKNIEEWVETLDFTSEYKNEIIYPFLAASLGTNIDDIKKTSAVEIVSLFAFRKPKASNSFHIMQEGMGGLIQKVAKKLESSGVKINTNSPVQSVEKSGNGYTIHFLRDGKLISEQVDFVVMAIHADVAGKLLKKDAFFNETSNLLQQFPYFEAHIVLHRDTNYINTQKPAFLNIYTDEQNQLTSSTMNLEIISPRLNGIYKSWMSDDETQQLKEKGLFLHETTFYHPLITPEFVANLDKLRVQISKIPSFCIVGGWTEGLETQNSAVVSAKRALEVYKQSK